MDNFKFNLCTISFMLNKLENGLAWVSRKFINFDLQCVRLGSAGLQIIAFSIDVYLL